MSIMEIITRLGLLYMAMEKEPKFRDDEDAYKNVLAIKRAIQLLVSVELKNEMENKNG